MPETLPASPAVPVDVKDKIEYVPDEFASFEAPAHAAGTSAAAAAASSGAEETKAFEASEHIELGDIALSQLCFGEYSDLAVRNLLLKLQAAKYIAIQPYSSPSGRVHQIVKFSLANGLQISSGELVALMGDFYGEKKRRISDANNEAEAEAFFLAAFDTLDKGDLREAVELRKRIATEIEVLRAGIQEKKPSAKLHSVGTKNNIAYGYITRYYSFPLSFLFGNRYWHLAKYNFDHFGDEARVAFGGGYRLAMKFAGEAAGCTNDVEKNKKITQAFKILFASFHFLTDLYASGHARTPRKAVYQHVINKQKTAGKATVAGFLAKAMHDLDGKHGVFLERQQLSCDLHALRRMPSDLKQYEGSYILIAGRNQTLYYVKPGVTPTLESVNIRDFKLFADVERTRAQVDSGSYTVRLSHAELRRRIFLNGGHVSTSTQERWKAQGDSACFEGSNERNLEQVLEVLRACIQDIADIFNGSNIDTQAYKKYFPVISAHQDHTPLFNPQGQPKTDVDDLNCATYRADWDPVPTLALLWTAGARRKINEMRAAGHEVVADIERVFRGLQDDLRGLMHLDAGVRVKVEAVSAAEYDAIVAQAVSLRMS